MTTTIKILFGTESGNAQYCADILGDEIKKLDLNYVVEDMGFYDPSQITQESLLIIVTSTHGNGDPPANAEGLLNYLRDHELDLSKLKYAVCGLGDSSFTYFAQCGKDFDEILTARHAQKVIERVDCDAEYDDEYDVFMNRILNYLNP